MDIGDYMKEIEITKNDSGQRVDKFLLKYFDKAPKSFIYKMIRKKRIKLNRGKANGDEMLSDGDKLQMYLSDETIDSFKDKKEVVLSERTFDIIYEDENILVVNKPAGLLSHGKNKNDKNTLIDQVLSYLYEKNEYVPEDENSFKPALCNRLDRNTSGIVIAGKTAESLRTLNEAVRHKKIRKLYMSLIKGEIKNSGRLEDFYSKNEDKNKAILGQGDKKIITLYRPVKAENGFTLIELELVTGKSHQIRVHMSAMGCPIVGDSKYGDSDINIMFRKKAGIKRQLLHAYKIEINGLEGNLAYLNGRVMETELPAHFIKAEKMIFET